MSIYDNIDKELHNRCWSRRELAQRAGINVNTMSTLFARKPDPMPEKYIDKIANALEMQPHELKGFGLVTEMPQFKPKDFDLASKMRLFYEPTDFSNFNSISKVEINRNYKGDIAHDSQKLAKLIESFNLLNADGQEAALSVLIALAASSRFQK